MGRLIGLDYGEVRCGVAVSDPLHIIATAKETIQVLGPKQVVREIAAICDREDAERVVVGMPFNMDGTRGASAEAAQALADRLQNRLSIPVETWDERLTTKTAREALIEAGTRREKRKGLVDKIAAQVMLQHYLDSQCDPVSPDDM
jgi:putative Holliday junction resolvase